MVKDFTTRTQKKYLGLILGTLGDVMAEGEPVILHTFGTFKPVQVKARINRLMGKDYAVVPHMKVYFKTGSRLMQKVNGQEDEAEECEVVEDCNEEEEEWYYGVDYTEQRKKMSEKKSHK